MDSHESGTGEADPRTSRGVPKEGDAQLNVLLTVAEIAEFLRVVPHTVYRLIHAGKLPATRVGSSYRVRSVDLNDYLERMIVRS